MKRPDISLSEEPGTLPLGGSDPTHALPGATGPRLVLGRYRLERRLGAGGFGVVWLGWDEKLEREVAVKAIPREDGSGERVEREARAAARLNHPGIVAVYELSWDEHDVFFVETPLWTDDLDGYAELVRHSPIPIAAGEWLATHHEFAAYTARGALDGFVVEAGLSAAGAAVGWLASLTGRTHDDLLHAAAAVAPGAEGVIALPWFAGARGPWWCRTRAPARPCAGRLPRFPRWGRGPARWR